jgi:hypothetical protein
VKVGILLKYFVRFGLSEDFSVYFKPKILKGIQQLEGMRGHRQQFYKSIRFQILEL